MNLFNKLFALNLDPLPKPGISDSTPLQTVITIVFTILGIISVIVIMISGIKFMTSRGDPQAVAKARETIIYAAVGIVVAVLAATILNFVVGHL